MEFKTDFADEFYSSNNVMDCFNCDL